MGMMNKEAIEIIKQFRDRQGNSSDDIEAFDLAIEALERKIYKSEARRWKRRYLDLKQRVFKLEEQQPCEDCISRADILDAIETWDKFGINAEQKLIRWQDHYVPYVHLDDVRNAIANMPSVTPSYNSIKTELKPCEDCISRAQALHACCDEWDKDYKAIMKSIRQLPQVTPKADSKWGSIGNNTDLETVPTNLQDWLSTFNTESATECFTAVQRLKERVNE